MKRFIIYIFLSVMFFASGSAQEWKIYASYHNATKAVKAGTQVFVLANGDLFSYDAEDESVFVYDKVNALSDFGIKDIAYADEAKTLVLLYDNGNIDILTPDGDTWNMPELKNKALRDKTLNALKVYGNKAFVCTNSGVAVINLSKRYFEGFYDLGEKIYNAIMENGTLYVSTAAGTHHGLMSANLLDVANWHKTSSAVFPYARFTSETEQLKQENAAQLDKVKDIVIDSPLRNFFYKLNMQGERLLVAGGNFNYPNIARTGTVMMYEDGKWSAFEEEAAQAEGKGSYTNVTDVVQDPEDAAHHWVGSINTGLYEFRDGKMVNHFSIDNSPLQSAATGSSGWKYVRATALAIDPAGNLWMANDQTEDVVKVRKKDGTWKSFSFSEIKSYPTFDYTIFDQRGWVWMNCRRTTSDGAIAGLLVVNTNGTIDNQSDDQHKYITTFSNQDGTVYTPNLYYCVTEDLDGAMWIGTNEGVFVSYEPRDVFNPSIMLSQVKVPRNDGSNLADYLLSSVPVKCITIDGGNRKWIGTLGNGVYLVSADGLETIHHFTKENSPLISNNINDIAINGTTGEVFIATDLGLCSFQGDATDPAETMDKGSLRAFPNPVRPEHVGGVHVTGMMANSDVKVVNAAGKLVAQGTSVGGQFNWNCCTGEGKRVASGIYYILAADEEGKKGAFAKVLIVR